jgi:hypothetical protein
MYSNRPKLLSELRGINTGVNKEADYTILGHISRVPQHFRRKCVSLQSYLSHRNVSRNTDLVRPVRVNKQHVMVYAEHGV